jgi:hypothetical protein
MYGSNRDRECSSLTSELKYKITLNYQYFTKITSKTQGFALNRNGAGCRIRTYAYLKTEATVKVPI